MPTRSTCSSRSSLEKRGGLTGSGDIRKDVFDELGSELGCELRYDDVEPWVGHRFAFAFVDQGDPQPVMAFQVADRDMAAGGLEQLTECAEGSLGYALDEDWAVLAETEKVAAGVLRDAAESPLSEDPEFRRWTGEAGDPGVMTMYAASEAGPAVVSAFEDSPYGFVLLPSLSGIDPLSMLLGMTRFSAVDPVEFGDDDLAMEATDDVPPGMPEAVPSDELPMAPRSPGRSWRSWTR